MVDHTPDQKLAGRSHGRPMPKRDYRSGKNEDYNCER